MLVYERYFVISRGMTALAFRYTYIIKCCNRTWTHKVKLVINYMNMLP